MDLQTEIQEALDANPLLEVDEVNESTSDSHDASNDHNSQSEISNPETAETTETIDSSTIETSEALEQQTISDELPIDSTWDDYTSAAPAASSGPLSDDYIYQGETTENLQDHLMWQMNLTPFTETDRAIAIAIIDAIEESGY